jgi:two-component system, NarL family, nitrate/nitrite response regulator NarL
VETPRAKAISASASEARAVTRETAPDVALIQVDVAIGLRLVRDLLALRPALNVLAYGLGRDKRELSAWAEAGVSRLIGRPATLAELVRSVWAAGAFATAPTAAEKPASVRPAGVTESSRDEMPRAALFTSREFDVLQLIAVGLTNQEIANTLCLELPTVKNHVQHVMRKLGVHRRAEAARYLEEPTNNAVEGEDLVSERALEWSAPC